MIDTYICVDRLRLHAHHGVTEQERTLGNDFEVSVQIRYLWIDAAKADSLDNTISYADIVDEIRQQMEIPAKLIENVAWRISCQLQQRFKGVLGCKVTVAKLTPPIAGAQMNNASVTIELSNTTTHTKTHTNP